VLFWKTPDELKSYLENEEIREALRRASSRFVEGRLKALASLGSFDDVRKRLRDVKEKALECADLHWSRVRDELSSKGAHLIEAEDALSADSIIYEICERHGIDLLIKGKSITSEEIGLNAFLEERGVEVIETDLGERIVQLFREKPSHLIVPAIHHTKEEVAKLFSRYFGEEIPPDPYVITKKVRADLRAKFLSARGGMTGINVVSSEPCAFYLMTNEGNGRLCSTVPSVQIILTGWEKIVSSLEDALFLLKVLPKNSVGLDFSSYVSIFTAPFRWKEREMYVVVLDNGRKRALEDIHFRHALRCIRCGACMNVCPVYQVLSGQGFSHIYMGGIGAVWTAITAGLDEAYKVAQLCTGCGSCNEVCPVEIPISHLVSEVKSRAEKRDLLEDVAVGLVLKRDRFSSVAEIQRLMGTYKGEPFLVWAKGQGLLKDSGDVNFYVGCLMEQCYPETALKAYLLLRALGKDVALFEEECCGLPALAYGRKSEFFRLGLLNLERYANGRKTLFICDSCYSTFREYLSFFAAEKPDVVPETLFSFLLKEGVKFSLKEKMKVMIHFPCHLRAWKGDEELERFVRSIDNLELVEHPTSRHCCGGAGLYKYKYPEISRAIFDVKAEAIKKHLPQAVITTCPSCYQQIKEQLAERGVDVDVYHLVDFLFEHGRCGLLDSIRFSDTKRQ